MWYAVYPWITILLELEWINQDSNIPMISGLECNEARSILMLSIFLGNDRALICTIKRLFLLSWVIFDRSAVS